MGDALFYHLTRDPAERTVRMLVEKSLERGWRVEVRGTERAALERLDAQLWQGPDDGFLPHGLAGGPHDADQPVLLTTRGPAANGAACLIAVDGAAPAPDEVAALERVCVLFDGLDGAAVARAREQWKRLTGAGCGAQYWSQESGRWEMKAQR